MSFHRTIKGFQNLVINGTMHVSVVIGKPISLTIKTDKQTEKRLKTNVKQRVLIISLAQQQKIDENRPISITLHLPSLLNLSLLGESRVSVSNVKAKDLTLSLSNRSQMDIQGKVQNLNLRIKQNAVLYANKLKVVSLHALLSNNCEVQTFISNKAQIIAKDNAKLTITGKARILSLRALSSANIDAQNLKVNIARVVSTDKSRITLDVKHELMAIASDSSSITYQGRPRIADITTLNTARVIAKS